MLRCAGFKLTHEGTLIEADLGEVVDGERLELWRRIRSYGGAASNLVKPSRSDLLKLEVDSR